ncbi:Cytochrome P450 76A2 [Vitis vinifera]|uniref:Cytochrome P450 76A2 n=1 Tax=Vitis vinifera TaxID=29760 RepID=A0A438EKF3_VITVI|nr:Cytochrome P450 76A2 [Vitis vinifera]
MEESNASSTTFPEIDQIHKRFNQIYTSRSQGWPIFGNIFDLGTVPHQTLYRLRPQHGPVLWLQLGAINTMVVQSAKAAAELFKNHDLSFLRPQRSIYVDRTQLRPRKCVDDMIRWIEEDAAKSGAEGRAGEVELPHFLFCMAFNLIGNITLSRDVVDIKSKDGHEFFQAMNGVVEWAGRPNIADFFPLLKRLDPLGMMRNMVRDMGQALNLIARFVKERDEERQSGMVREKRDFLDVLLECRDDEKEGPHEMSDNKVKIIVLEMFFAGSDTTSSTLEWAMTELLRRPESMRKAQEELDRVVDHMEDTNFMGYFVPKNTQVFVNAWAIGRDPDAWKEPLSFKPDRFLGSNLDYKGQNFEFIPFGSGRRICIGISLANKLLPLALASLLHCFDWSLAAVSLQRP